MFGESESESPRVGSPWDALISLSSSPARSRSRTPSCSDLSGDSETDLKRVYSNELPKLVPEAEAGNVEYKLQLISPTPERFLRLVTQLKWRLLEGGGQAFYELGVADSGQLVGLTRSNLEKSLETLEAMAGEIGASVVVVKEIEVPEGMWEKAAKDGGVHVGGGDFPKVKEVGTLKIPAMGGHNKPLRTRPTEWGAVEVLDPASHPVSESEGTTTDDEPLVLSVPSPPSSPEGGVFSFDLGISEVFKPFHSKNPSPLHPANGTPKKDKKIKPPLSKKKTQQEKSVPKKTRRDEWPLQDKSRLNPKPQPNPKVNTSPTVSRQVEVPASLKELETLHAPLQKDNPTSITNNVTLVTLHPTEPRTIVEALVVRKLSTEEAFLDFGGFDLAD